MVAPDKIFGRLGNRMFQGAYIYAQARRGEIPDIYIQDHSYFDEFREDIRKLYGEGVGNIDMVSIHVRRGDYVNNSFYVDLTKTDYYEKAMEQFPEADFLVFSDNIEWCKQQPIFFECEFSEGLNEVDDLNLMASCNGHIMANSSFSWWGSYLGRGKTVAPKQWFTDGANRVKLLEEWIKI